MDSEHEKRIILPALLVILIVVGGYLWLKPKYFSHTASQASSSRNTQNQADVEISRVDIGPTSTVKLPAGFPANLPVDTTSVTESYKAVYNAEGATQYSFSYRSPKTRSTLWKEYSDFMAANGFSLDASSTDESLGTLSGTKGSETITIVISWYDQTSYVQIDVLER